MNLPAYLRAVPRPLWPMASTIVEYVIDAAAHATPSRAQLETWATGSPVRRDAVVELTFLLTAHFHPTGPTVDSDDAAARWAIAELHEAFSPALTVEQQIDRVRNAVEVIGHHAVLHLLLDLVDAAAPGWGDAILAANHANN